MWLSNWQISDAQRAAGVKDVRARLQWLARRWDDREDVEPLLRPHLELAETHVPEAVDVGFRAGAVVAVRNSSLEPLHVDGYLRQEDWIVLTRAAAFALRLAVNLPVVPIPHGHDPFSDLLDQFPLAVSAFRALAQVQPGEARTWQPPPLEPLPLPTELERRSPPTSYNSTTFSWPGRIEANLLFKPKRNDPCPCGSGRKFKRCCEA